ncbi:MAG TPA: membrane protein insertase YidC [Azospirillaceae bacterium]|nr:membrane protein insertase YidC [Azospirillaceae bacterium]
MTDQRNLILAIVISIAILLGFQYFYEAPRVKERQAQQAAQRAQQTEETTAPTPAVPGGPVAVAPSAAPATTRSREQVLAEQQAQRIRVSTPALHGSINAVGGRIDALTLADYHETPDPKSPEIVLLSPAGSESPYYAEFGWVPEDKSVKVPDANTVWTVQGGQLTPDSPVILSWNNGQGLTFERIVAVDKNYMFTVNQHVQNDSGQPVALHAYALISRHNTPQTAGFYILHEGPLGVVDGTLKEFKYSDLQGETSKEFKSTGGWLGITDKYWLVSLAPEQKAPVSARFLHTVRDNQDRYQVDYLGDAVTVKPGETGGTSWHMFAGAKQVRLLDTYSSELGIEKFDLAIDFGWFYFLTKPFFYALDFLGRLFGNFGVAILVFTVFVKAVFFPLANKSYVSMSKMKALQPQMQQLRQRFAEDPQRMNQELMALYKREKVNPVSGCLPILIQIPVFFALYKVLFVTIEMRHAPFFGWIHDLSAPDPTTIFNLFGLLPFSPPAFLMIGIWPLIMGVTMWLQQKLNPAPADPMQQKVFAFLPIIFTFMLASFPAGLVIYWAWNNALSILQQWVIMRRMGVKVT